MVSLHPHNIYHLINPGHLYKTVWCLLRDSTLGILAYSYFFKPVLALKKHTKKNMPSFAYVNEGYKGRRGKNTFKRYSCLCLTHLCGAYKIQAKNHTWKTVWLLEALIFHLKMPYLSKFDHSPCSPDSALSDSAFSRIQINPQSWKVFLWFFF